MDEQLKSIFADTLHIRPAAVTDELSMDTAPEWDSLAHMGLIVALEEAFGLDFEFGEIIRMRSVQGIKQVLAEKAGQSRDAA